MTHARGIHGIVEQDVVGAHAAAAPRKLPAQDRACLAEADEGDCGGRRDHPACIVTAPRRSLKRQPTAVRTKVSFQVPISGAPALRPLPGTNSSSTLARYSTTTEWPSAVSAPVRRMRI